MVSLVLLGPVDVPARCEVRSVAAQFGTPRLRCLLAALALRANTFADADWLTEILWPDDVPATPDAALHNLVFRLRARLRDRGVEQRLQITTRAGGYTLLADRAEIDALLFTDRIRAGCDLVDTDPAAAVDVLDAARTLWGGPAYGEFTDRQWASAAVEELREYHVRGVEATADALLAIDRPAEAAVRLAAVADAHPYREGLHGRLIEALWRDDRPAAALAAYQQLRQRLSSDLGADPTPRLQELQSAILAAAPPPVDETRPVRRSDQLVGRDGELADLAGRIRAGRCVTVLGTGGVGKTSIVDAHLATRSDGQVWYVELAAIATAEAVVHAVITASGTAPRRDVDPVEVLVDAFDGRRGVLVLDNCEHVVDSAAQVVRLLLARCPDLAVVTTSRTPLGIAAEQIMPIEPLPVPSAGAPAAALRSAESVQLFIRRAETRDPRHTLNDEDVVAVAEICRRLDGLPLAIELAAATAAAIPPTVLVDRLQWRFRVLRGAHGADPRHRSLQALIDWSSGLLDDGAARVLDIVSIFPSTFSLDDAEGLAAATGRIAPGDVAAAVVDLVDASLLSVSGNRYRMLETVRAYGLSRLDTAGMLTATQRAHAEVVAARIAPLATDLFGPGHARAAEMVAERFDDVRQAVANAVDTAPLADAILAGVMPYLESTMSSEVAAWARNVRQHGEAATGDATTGAAASALAAACARFDGDLPVAQRWARDGLARNPTPPVTVYLRLMLVEVAQFRGDLDDALRRASDFRAAAQSAGMIGAVHMADATVVLLRAYRGGPGDPSGVECCSAALTLADRCAAAGHAVVAAWCRYIAAECVLDADPGRAGELLDGAIDAARQHTDRYLLGVALTSRASIEVRHGALDCAASHLMETVDHWRDAGNWTHQWVSLRAVIDVLARLGRDDAAAILLGAVRGHGVDAGPESLGADAGRLTEVENALRAHLGDRTVDELAARGAGLTRTAVIDLAIGELRTAAGR
ncbi:BTAD domain-containing putative transcriptional regulator [Gordonia sp. NPDC003424]